MEFAFFKKYYFFCLRTVSLFFICKMGGLSGITNPLQTLSFNPSSASCSAASDSLRPHGLYSPWNSPGQNTGVGSLSLLQESFPTQKSNPGLPNCRQILYQLSHQGSPRILGWVAYPFSSQSLVQEQSWDSTGGKCKAQDFSS